MDKLLLHVCCCHCAAYSIVHWAQAFTVTAFWYNPNIAPIDEYHNRLNAMRTYAEIKGLELIEMQSTELPENTVSYPGLQRCSQCFHIRLLQTAQFAKQNAFDSFSTSLLISPHQEHPLLREIGEKVSKEVGITFAYEDLRQFYSKSRGITGPLKLYRQQYCGCIAGRPTSY